MDNSVIKDRGCWELLIEPLPVEFEWNSQQLCWESGFKGIFIVKKGCILFNSYSIETKVNFSDTNNLELFGVKF
jgi:hypothetical protein